MSPGPSLGKDWVKGGASWSFLKGDELELKELETKVPGVPDPVVNDPGAPDPEGSAPVE